MRRLILSVALLPALFVFRPAPRSVAPDPPAEVRGMKEMLAALPLTSRNPEGAPDSPINLLFVGPESSIRRAISRAAWTEGTASMARALAVGLLDMARLRAPDIFPPVSDEYLFGRAQDEAFLKQLTFVRSRHHFRLWRAPFEGPGGEPVWAGTANLDASLTFLRRRFVHRIDPEIDRERDYILGTVRSASGFVRAVRVARDTRLRGGADANGCRYRTDGRILVMYFN